MLFRVFVIRKENKGKILMRQMIILTALCLIASAALCSAQQVNLDQGVASEILRGVTASQVAGALSENQQLLLNYRVVAIEQTIAQEAVQMGPTERLDVQNALQQSRRQILIQARKDELARTIPPASEDDIKSIYKQQPELWTLPAAYKLDVLELDKSNERTMRKAKRMESGEPIPDDKLTSLKSRIIVTQASGQWLSRNLIAPDIWAQLPTMEKGTIVKWNKKEG